MRIQTVIITLVSFVSSSCGVTEADIKRYQQLFYEKELQIENLLTELKACNLPVGYFVNENKLPEHIQDMSRKLEMKFLSPSYADCENMIEYEFLSSWCKNASLYFTYDPCNDVQSVKGYHAKVSEMVEVWGLGKGWIMWIDYDFI